MQVRLKQTSVNILLEFSLGEGSCCEARHSWRTQAFYLHGPCDGPRLDFRQYGDPGI